MELIVYVKIIESIGSFPYLLFISFILMVFGAILNYYNENKEINFIYNGALTFILFSIWIIAVFDSDILYKLLFNL